MIGPPSRSNREAIERYGKVSVVAELPYTDDLSPKWVAEMAESQLSGLKSLLSSRP